MNIYTKTGDDGTTALYRGGRVDKDCLQVEAYGSVDELNSHIGYIRALTSNVRVNTMLAQVQDHLFIIGADLAAIQHEVNPRDDAILRLQEGDESILEREIDRMEAELPPLRHFILPTGSPAAAYVHITRSVCRRAERRVITLRRQKPVNKAILVYLNRLSDYLFVLSRWINRSEGRGDTLWLTK